MSKPGLILFKFIGVNVYKQLASKTYCNGTKGNPVYAMIRNLRTGFIARTSLCNTSKLLETAVEYLQNDEALTKFLEKKKGNSGFLSNDISNVYSAIAEIVACYNLKMAGFKVVPIDENNQNKTPDFKIMDPDDNVAYLEVNCKNYEENDTTVSLCSNSKHRLPNGGILGTTISVHSPFGRALKSNENSIVQAIQKISQIKQGSKQAIDDKPFILYIDLDTGNTRGMSHLFDTTYPIYHSKDGEITSGVIWHAMYGRKGYPIFERYPYRMLPCSRSWWHKLKNKLSKNNNAIPLNKIICTMEHNGRFFTDNKISATVFRCEDHIIICENRRAISKLCRSTRSCLAKMPKLSVAKSMLNLIPGMVAFKNMCYRWCVKRLSTGLFARK